MKKKIATLFILFISLTSLFSQNKNFTLNGRIIDDSSNETLIGVNILFPEINDGITTNNYGFYSITLPEGTYKLQITYLGYKTQVETIVLTGDITRNFNLTPETESLEEIVITQEKDIERLDVRSPQISINRLSAQTIKKIPTVLGEADVLRSIQLLPGVTSAGEGASGFNVRGGAADQNLILLDEAIIFNSSHLFGVFSVFNPDAIKDLKLFKGGIPARYGGRVSSVLDIYQKEGNSKDFTVSGGIGAVSSRLLLEGPLKKDKGAFLVAGRSTYAHLFLPIFDINNEAYFFDLNAKLNYNIDDKNSIYLSGYFGQDVFNIQDNFSNDYGNAVANLRWNHLFSDKLFSNLSLIYSEYFYGLNLDFVGFEWNSGIQNINLKYDFTHYLSNKFQLRYGINNIYYRFNPGRIEPSSLDSGIVEDQLTVQFANELAGYIDIEHKVTSNLSLQYGLRLSNFLRLGQDEINVYANDDPLIFDPLTLVYRGAIPVDVSNPDRSDVLATFTNFEPRFSLAYAFNNTSSFKASYTRLAQYLHLLSNTQSPTPLDIWQPSGPFIEPQLLDQFAVGYFKNFSFRGSDFSLETEAFYKSIDNRIDYIDGADLIANEAIEQVILAGEARAFGLEFLLRKNTGKLKGWLSYTLSRSEQRAPGRNENETGINNGEYYVTPFDKTNDLSLFLSYDLNSKWSFNANMTYQTGQPTNLPIGQFEFQGVTSPFFGPRNSQRLPDFHRLDISATLTPKQKPNRNWQSQWVFSLFNVYNRMNAASINFRQNPTTGTNEALRTSIFGIIPSVTYNFKI